MENQQPVPTSSQAPESLPPVILKTIVVAALFIFPVLGFILGINYQKYFVNGTPQAAVLQPNTTISVTPQPSPVFKRAPVAQTEVSAYPKRQFTSNSSFISTSPYPSILTSIADEKLVSMQCNGPFSIPIDGSSQQYMSTKSTTPQPLTDQVIINALTALKPLYPSNQIVDVTYCNTDKNETYLMYTLQGKEGNPLNSINVSQLDQNHVLKTLSSYKTKYAGTYDACSTVLQLSTDNLLYARCVTGDTTQTAQLRAFNLVTGTSNVLYECSYFEGNDAKAAKLTCK